MALASLVLASRRAFFAAGGPAMLLARRWHAPRATPPLRWLSTTPADALASPPPAAADALALAAEAAASAALAPPKVRIFELNNIKTSPQKVGMVMRLVNVRGLPVAEAADHLRFLPQKGATFLRGLLQMALRRGPLENKMDSKRMVIDMLWSGRSSYIKRADHKAKGRMGTLRKPRTHLYARVREAAPDELDAFHLKLKKGVPDKAAYKRERKAAREPVLRAHQAPRVNFWPLC